jgi:hypothetical protein
MVALFEFLYDKITKDLVLSVAIPIGLLLALVFAWDLGLQRTTLAMGKKLGDHSGGQTFQDAITPTWKVNLTLFVWASIVVFFATCMFKFGAIVSLVLIVGFVACSAIASMVFIPKPESRHYVDLVQHSLTNRFANFNRDGDINRAQATEEILLRLREQYKEVFDSGRPH